MKVLVACEESQAVTIELRKLGHEAYSCDLFECSGGYPEYHIKQDVIPLLNGSCEFKTCDGVIHKINNKWDMIIAFPPCTYMTNGGGGRMNKPNYKGKKFANGSKNRSKTFPGIAKAMAEQWGSEVSND